MINRTLEENVETMIGKQKAIIITGARQVGKSTLLENLLGKRSDVMWLNGDDADVRQLFETMTSTRIQALLGNAQILVIDEAQRISDVGLKLKLITDQVKRVQVIATGSSSFELTGKINEPLTGRKREFRMFPLTFGEMVKHTNLLEEQRMIPHRMVFGYYPEVVCNPGEERPILRELSDSYLYRDILSLDGINKPDKLIRLLQALAYQIGNQVNLSEVGRMVGLDPKTVERYIDILEKSYIIFRLGSFSRNLRNELKNSRKIYFWDLGIRNAVIGNLSQVDSRNDAGALWENFCITERMKALSYRESFARSWFWRTQQQKEIDYIEEEDGAIKAFEFKWNDSKVTTRCPSSFASSYPDAEYQVITPSNITDFLP